MRRPGFLTFGRRRASYAARRPRWLDVLAALGFILLLALLGAEVKRRFMPLEVVAGIGEAIDGDSLSVSGQMIRLKGIDAPEYRQTCQDAAGRTYECGVVARRWLQGKLRRGPVRCEIDGHDRYGRALGWCAVAEENINAAIVRAGLAIDYGGHAVEEREARAQKAGLWAGTFVTPAEWRASHPRDGTLQRVN